MCFSAPASFIASGLLSSTGITAIKKNKQKKMLAIAAVPLIFGIQQLTEGLQWLAQKPSITSNALTYAFMFFAYIFWPTYIPAATYLAEPDEKRKNILKAIFLVGLATSLYLLYFFTINTPEMQIVNNNIKYSLHLPNHPSLVLFYLIAILGGCLASSHKFIRILGISSGASLSIALFLYAHAWPSVWCFFSAFLSLIIAFHFISQPKLTRHNSPR